MNEYFHKISLGRKKVSHTTEGKKSMNKKINNYDQYGFSKNSFSTKSTLTFERLKYDITPYPIAYEQFENPPFFMNFMHGEDKIPKINPKLTVASQEEIGNTYTFKFPIAVAELEKHIINHEIGKADDEARIDGIHLLSEFIQNCKYIKTLIEGSRIELNKFRKEKEDLQREMRELKYKYEGEINEISRAYDIYFMAFHQNLKKDFVENQNEFFRLQKEIVILTRDKTQLEQEVEKSLIKIRVLETKLFSTEMFELQTDDVYLNTISTRNLKNQIEENKYIIH